MTTQDQLFYTACELVECRHSNKSRLNATTWTLLRELGIASRLPTKLGCRGGGGRNQRQQQQQQQRISTVVCHRSITKHTTIDTHTSSPINEILTTSTRRHTTTGRGNLIHITRVTTPSLYLESSHINVCCLNTRSLKNKTLSISDYVTSHDYGIMCQTETQLRSDIDAVCISEMVPTGYEFYHVPRNTGRIGGGEGIMFKTGLSVTTVSTSPTDTTVSHFDYRNCRVEHHGATIHFIIVYRSPTSTQNGLKTSVFFQEWSSFIEHVAVECADSIIVGDVNFHLDSDTNTDAHRFKDSLSTCGLKQHVNEPTHIKGQTLDLVITNEDSNDTIQKLEVTDPVLCDTSGNISGDHYAISLSARLSKPRTNRVIVEFRKLRAIDTTTFKECICQE